MSNGSQPPSQVNKPESSQWEIPKPGTFTFLGRNDIAINWIGDYRKENNLPKIKLAYVLGSGMVEPFTIAALPGMEEAQIVAVDVNTELIGMGEHIKSGGAISWADIGVVAANPGRPNSDFLDRSRLLQSFDILRGLGSLSRLGPNFNEEQMQVDSSIADRVTFVENDALTFLQHAPKADFIGDLFIQVNANKMETLGQRYTRLMVLEGLRKINDNGLVLIGDTGDNLSTTLGHLAQDGLEGKLNLSSLVHAVNLGNGFKTSHYLLASKLDPFPRMSEIIESVDNKLHAADGKTAEGVRNFENFSRLDPIFRSNKAELTELAEELQDGKAMNLAYASNGHGEGVSWMVFGPGNPRNALSNVVPEKGQEYSPNIIFPSQKPHFGN